jgi:hypothetical protein
VIRPRARGFGISCGPAPESLRHPYLHTGASGRGGAHEIWGAVDPRVASVEVVLASGRRLTAETTTGERYEGRWSGALRFFLLEARWARADHPLYVRLLAADGALLGVAGAEGYGADRRSGGRLVARGRVGPVRWALRAFTQLAHAPLPGDEERVVRKRCVGFVVLDSGQRGGPTCDDPDYAQVPPIDVSRTCKPLGVQVYGMLRPGRRVEAVLGDGRHLRPRTFPLPRSFGRMRAFVLALPPDVALRSLATVGAGGREVLIDRIGPGVADCPNASSGWIFGFGLEMPRFGPGPPVLQLRDHGELLCATLGLPHPQNLDCGRPPLEAEDSWLFSRVTPEGTTVAGVVPPDVASVEVTFAGAGTQVVPTGAPAPYAGRYRDLIRTFSLAIPGEHPPRTVTLEGPDGKRLASRPVFGGPEPERPPELVLRARGGWRLYASTLRDATTARRFGCLQLTRGEPRDDALGCGGLGSHRALVSCRPWGVLVYGLVDAAVRGVELRSTAGTTRARIVSLRGLGIDRRAFLAELPASAGLRALVVRGKRTRTLRKRLPPASRQCGYDESIWTG